MARKIFCDGCEADITQDSRYVLELDQVVVDPEPARKPAMQARELCAACVGRVRTFVYGMLGNRAVV